MSSEIQTDTNTGHPSGKELVRAEGVGKCYQIYDKPRDRLFQMIFRGRRQYYKEFWALRDASFSIREGESFGILGRNGSGKSTLLQIIAGVLSPTCGELSTHGRIAALLELGSGFNPEFTGRENAYLNGAILGLSREEMDDLMPEIERFAGVGEFFDRPVKLYSSGMMVRVAFAVQVQVKPDILIVDEALAVGDALFQKKCFQKINQLLSNGTSLLLVSHDIEAIRYFTQKSLLLDQGKTLAYGDSASVILAYKALQAEEQSAYTSNQLVEFQSEKKEIFLENKKTHFTSGDVILHSVTLLNQHGEKESVFYVQSQIIIDVCIETVVDLKNLFVSLTIINNLGIKIHSWGTWNQDRARYTEKDYSVIMQKTFKKGKKYTLRYQCECNLGPGFYETQVGITLADSIDSGGVQDIAWQREAAFFEVKPLKNYTFGGLCDMKMSVAVLE
jgi:lipopolysaccharide transport system ATP-binding protein